MAFNCLWLGWGWVKVGGLEEGRGTQHPHLPPLTSVMCFWLLPTSPTATTTSSEWNILHSPAPLHCIQGHVWYLADAGNFIVRIFFFFYSLLLFQKRKDTEHDWQERKGGLFIKLLLWSTCLSRVEVMWAGDLQIHSHGGRLQIHAYVSSRAGHMWEEV